MSSHNYERTPDDSELRMLQDEMFNFDGTAVGKIAAMANDIGDAERLLSLLDSPGAALWIEASLHSCRARSCHGI